MSLCECGHPFEGNHQTPGTECSALDCDCGRFKAAAPDVDIDFRGDDGFG